MKQYILVLALAVSCQAFFKPGAQAPMEDEQVDEDYIFRDDEITEIAPIVPKSSTDQQKCGVRHNKGEFRIGGTTKALFTEFNWVVPIMEVLWNGTEEYVCVGSLIHPEVVMTVAHYFTSKRNLIIKAGDYDISHTKERLLHQVRDVSSVKLHPNFKLKNLKYDIALLFLSTPVNPAPHVGFACLPPALSMTPADTACYVTGWGMETYDENGEISHVLKKVEVPAVADSHCQEVFRDKIGPAFNLHKTWMCAGGEEGRDACLRDGGGPLVCPYKNPKIGNQYFQAGIVSWGNNCGLKGVPGVYSNVAALRQWITDTMAAGGYTTEYYTP